MTAQPKRRWYQFSLRSLLVFMTVAGFGLGYIGYERRLAQQQREIQANLRAHGIQLTGGESRRPDWLKQILGDDSAGQSGFVLVGTRNATTSETPEAIDEAVTQLKRLPNIFSLHFPDIRIDDEGLAHFGGLTQIKWVDLQETKVTNRGLQELRELKSLKVLNLTATQTGDVGLKEIARHQDLEVLHLWGTKITDAGLQELRQLKKLRSLTISKPDPRDEALREKLNRIEKYGKSVVRACRTNDCDDDNDIYIAMWPPKGKKLAVADVHGFLKGVAGSDLLDQLATLWVWNDKEGEDGAFEGMPSDNPMTLGDICEALSPWQDRMWSKANLTIHDEVATAPHNWKVEGF